MAIGHKPPQLTNRGDTSLLAVRHHAMRTEQKKKGDSCCYRRPSSRSIPRTLVNLVGAWAPHWWGWEGMQGLKVRLQLSSVCRGWVFVRAVVRGGGKGRAVFKTPTPASCVPHARSCRQSKRFQSPRASCLPSAPSWRAVGQAQGPPQGGSEGELSVSQVRIVHV